MTATYQYDAFGAVKTKTGSGDTAYRFTGEMNDSQVARELYYLRARYYDPALGRFLSRDPLPAGNPYVYVYNNPALLVDPTGLCVFGIPCPPPPPDPRDLGDPIGDVVGAGVDVAQGAGGYASDKGQDFVAGVQATLDSPGTAPQNAIAFGISVFSTGDRGTFGERFVYYENCQGLCQLVSNRLGNPGAYTPGYIAFGQGEFTQALLYHEYQHYLQSQHLGPLYLPEIAYAVRKYGYWNSPFEVNAREAETSKESQPPFGWLPPNPFGRLQPPEPRSILPRIVDQVGSSPWSRTMPGLLW